MHQKSKKPHSPYIDRDLLPNEFLPFIDEWRDTIKEIHKTEKDQGVLESAKIADEIGENHLIAKLIVFHTVISPIALATIRNRLYQLQQGKLTVVIDKIEQAIETYRVTPILNDLMMECWCNYLFLI